MNTKIIFNTPMVLKKAAASRAEKEGIPLSFVLNNALRSYSEGKMHIETVYENETWTPAAERRILKRMEEAKNPKNLSPKFYNAEDAIAWLRAERVKAHKK